jgi:dihydroneopterin aldolase
MAALKSSWQIAATAGEPHSTIRVQNLQASVWWGRDAWGQAEKTQPILISATISLRQPFEKASTEDSVNNSSTVNYGTLSRAILDAVDNFPLLCTDRTLPSLLNQILCRLTTRDLDSREPTYNGDCFFPPVLERTTLKSLELKLMLPKASLIGSGVGLSGTIVYAESGEVEAYSMTLKLCGLRIPTLIGVNPNERLAKQVVVANIELDCWSKAADLYNELEEIVVKVCTFMFSFACLN